MEIHIRKAFFKKKMGYLESLKPRLGSEKSRNEKISEGGSIDEKGKNVPSFELQECAPNSAQKTRVKTSEPSSFIDLN